MNRAALFAHYDTQNSVKPYVTEYLARLAPVCPRIIFVSTAELADRELDKIRPHVESILLRDNLGYDFGMWRYALDRTDLAGCDELILTNSSVLGPIRSLEPIFRRMSAHACDFWAMTDNFEHRWHLQSYFLVLKRAVVQSNAFRGFMKSILPYRRKGPVVLSYEVGLTSFLSENGFRPGAFLPIESWASWTQRRRMDLERSWNPTLFWPEKLISLGMPFVKVALLRDNIGDVPLDPVYQAMSDAGYDIDLIELDAPMAAPRNLRAHARRIWSRFAPPSDGSSALSWPDPRAGGT